MRSELSFSGEGSCRRPIPFLITNSLKLQYCSRSSLPKVLSNTAAQNITEEARKEKTCGGDHRPLDWRLTKMMLHHRFSPKSTKNIRSTFSKNTFAELLLVFQLFKELDLEILYIIFKFQKVFAQRIFKNGYTFLEFVGMFIHNVGPLIEILYLDLLNLNGGTL